MLRTYHRIVSLFLGLCLSAALAPACSGQSVSLGSTLSAAAMTYQSRPPEWAVGRFKGKNKKYFMDLDMTISSSGAVTVHTTDRDGDTETFRTSYRNGRIIIDGNPYRLQEILRGIRLVQEDNTSNYAELHKFGGIGGYDPRDFEGGGGSGSGRYDGRVPSWAIGTFRGYNSKYQNDVEMTITSNGRVTSRVTERNGRTSTSTGSYRDGRIEISGKRFTVQSLGGGLRTIEQGDRSHRVDYRRVSGSGIGRDDDYDDRDDRPPSWAVGVFEGRNERYDNDVEMTITSSGRVTSRITERNGRVFTERGNYRSGRIEIGGKSYTVERTREGIVTTQVDDRSNRVYYRDAD